MEGYFSHKPRVIRVGSDGKIRYYLFFLPCRFRAAQRF